MKTLTTLMELATRELDEAADRLAKANQQVSEAKVQCEQLQQYRQEYLDQHHLVQKMGIHAIELQNARKFLKNLDGAIQNSELVLQNLQYQTTLRLAEWQKCQTKMRSYEVLLERKQQKIYNKELKADQKMMDEFASNQKRFSLT